MKLLSLHLGNVRKFTGKRVTITGIGPGITVVSEANEFGKSTVFDAVHALFFEKYGSSAKPVKSLQPYAGGAVEVAAEVETDGARFLVEKRFLSRKMARITRLSDKTTVAQDDEAERWISGLLGASGEGPAGLLWVRQGVLGLEPDSPKEKTLSADTRRDLLSSVAGEIDAMTGGRRMDRVMRRLAEDLAEFTTRTGKKSGAWKAAADEVATLEADLQRVSAQVAALDHDLAARKAAEDLLARLDHPDAKARRDAALAAAQSAMEVARAYAGQVTAARQERDIAGLQAKGAKAELDGFLLALATLTSAQGTAQAKIAKAAQAEGEVLEAKKRLDAAQEANHTARKALTLARASLDTARHQTAARKARLEAGQYAERIAKAEAAQTAFDSATARAKALTATPDRLAQIEAAAGDVARHEAAVQAQSTLLQMHYLGDARIMIDGLPLPDGVTISLSGETRLTVPGLGDMMLRVPTRPEATAMALAKAQTALTGLLAQSGADTLHVARALAAQRAEAVRQAAMAKALLETVAPEGLGQLRAAKAEADLAASDANDLPLPPFTTLTEAVTAAVAAEDVAAKALARAESDHALARETAAQARAAAETAAFALDQAKTAAGPAETQDQRRAEFLRADAQATEALRLAEARLADVSAAAPDLATTQAELKRAQDASDAAAQQRSKVANSLTELSAQIRTMAGTGIEERRDEIAGQLDTARATEARFARKAAALMRLQTALEAERAAAQDTYFGPVQQELKPLLSILHRDAALTFDSDSLLPKGLTRGLAEEGLDDLSGGTREQIAILTRLAFARLIARQGRHMPIMLDDALVYSDDDRIIKMFTALTRVAQDQQIIVFSCRQLAFQDLGGTRPTVQITDM